MICIKADIGKELSDIKDELKIILKRVSILNENWFNNL